MLHLTALLTATHILAAEASPPSLPVQRGAKVIPLIRISGSTAPVGELSISPSVLFAVHARADLQVSPIFKASTKDGSATLNLTQPASGSAWSLGGGLVLHILYPNTGASGDCANSPNNPTCAPKNDLIARCDKNLDVKKQTDADGKETYRCTKAPSNPADKAYCDSRPDLGASINIDPDRLCEGGRERYVNQAPPEIYQRRYPLAQIYAGALIGQRKYEYLKVEGDTLSRIEEPRMTTSALIGLVTVTNSGRPKFPFTFEATLGYRTKLTASKTPARWCVDKGVLPIDGVSAPVQSCTDGVLGAPTLSKTLSLGAFFGGTDIVEERWRFAVGPEVAYDLVTRRRGVAFKIPMTLRLTPSTSGAGYLGEYKGLLRITPSLGMDWDANLGTLGTKVLLVLDLLGQQDLFGSMLSGL